MGIQRNRWILVAAVLLNGCGSAPPREKSEAQKVCEARGSESLACFEAKVLERRQIEAAKAFERLKSE